MKLLVPTHFATSPIVLQNSYVALFYVESSILWRLAAIGHGFHAPS